MGKVFFFVLLKIGRNQTEESVCQFNAEKGGRISWKGSHNNGCKATANLKEIKI